MQQVEKQQSSRKGLRKSSHRPLSKNLLTEHSAIDINELKNSKRELDYMENEYLKLANRMEEVADPSYALELTERILTVDAKIKKGKKGRKRLEVDQVRREKKLDKAIKLGEPYLQKEIDKYKIEISIMQGKVAKANARLDRNADKLRELSIRRSQGNSSLRELEKVAENVGVKENAGKNSDPVKAKEKDLLLQQKNLMRDIRMINTKSYISKSEFKKKANTLNKEITEISDKIQKKNEY
eukprot:TRINITY_DN4535_c0_g1_i23.p1 TRINITY_DN4535_c0_g1~~TRINITY_DN4535_c0_g1_i23.p1  ORF type:complete len:240 (+),score=64.95 TRINITY_DN4535_c0_g1_i23:708-1427(+)